MAAACSEQGCNRKQVSRGLCSSHYRRWRQGLPTSTPIRSYREGCLEEGCEGKHWARGYCRPHYAKLFPSYSPREQNLRGKYGVTTEDYDAWLLAQGGGCAICGVEPEEGKYLLIDHDHACCGPRKACPNCVRGVLCAKCNTGLHFLENISWQEKARAYLLNPTAL